MANNILALGTSLSVPIEGNGNGTKYVMCDLADENGLAIMAHCIGYAGTVTTTAALYRPGCMLMESDRGSFYINIGTTASPNFYHVGAT